MKVKPTQLRSAVLAEQGLSAAQIAALEVLAPMMAAGSVVPDVAQVGRLLKSIHKSLQKVAHEFDLMKQAVLRREEGPHAAAYMQLTSVASAGDLASPDTLDRVFPILTTISEEAVASLGQRRDRHAHALFVQHVWSAIGGRAGEMRVGDLRLSAGAQSKFRKICAEVFRAAWGSPSNPERAIKGFMREQRLRARGDVSKVLPEPNRSRPVRRARDNSPA